MFWRLKFGGVNVNVNETTELEVRTEYVFVLSR